MWISHCNQGDQHDHQAHARPVDLHPRVFRTVAMRHIIEQQIALGAAQAASAIDGIRRLHHFGKGKPMSIETLTARVAFYVGFTTKDGVKLPEQVALASAHNVLSRYSVDGYTIHGTAGVWGGTAEDSAVIEVFCHPHEPVYARAHDVAKDLAITLDQTAVGVHRSPATFDLVYPEN